jgi:hypothetical protein
MYKFLGIIICFCVIACTSNSKKTQESDLILHYNLVWSVNEKENNPEMDRNAQFIINAYQDLLKGYAQNDTSYIKASSLQMAKTSDSLGTLKLSKDTAMQDEWVDGLGNISNELQGVLESNMQGDKKELTISINMLSVQILNLLASVGYKQRTIYIFNFPNEYIEDGVYWFGMQKNSMNPYNKEQKEALQALGILQEMK